MSELYQSLVYPDRAENMSRQDIFKNYKVFLDHWDQLAEEVKYAYEGAYTRNQSKIIIVHGPQGAGKSLFSTRLVSDFQTEKKDKPALSKQNLWHRITSGIWDDKTAVEKVTYETAVTKFESEEKWYQAFRESKPEQAKVRILILDNSERTYLASGLLDLTQSQILKEYENPALYRQVAEKLVDLARTQYQGTVVLIFLNDKKISDLLLSEITRLHSQVVKSIEFPMPGPTDKETVIRTNVNLLNSFSYWFCLDKAGPDYKKDVYSALLGSKTYPDCFSAINEAWARARKDRIGRGANRNNLTLVVLCNLDQSQLSTFNLSKLSSSFDSDISESFFRSVTLGDGWARTVVTDVRAADLLESEWNLRLILLSDPFVTCLLDSKNHGAYSAELLKKATDIMGIGTWQVNRQQREKELRDIVKNCPISNFGMNSDFWSKDQARSKEYEPAIKAIFPDYNTKKLNTLTYRPDYVKAEFIPCTILAAPSDDNAQINQAISRRANIIEFTAQKDATIDSVVGYLRGKIPNYVDIMYQ